LADIFETYTVGVGLTVHPQSSDREWNKDSRVWWANWERLADNASRQTFGTLQGLIARSWFFDGECFILLTVDAVGRWPRLQLIEAHRVRTPEKLISDEGKTIVDGVKIDEKSGRPIGYYIDGNEKPIPASSIIHVFEPSRAGQYRGIPFLSSALNLLADLSEIEKLEIKAARAAAVVANILTTASGEVSAEDLIANGGNVSTNSTTSEVSAYQERLGGETIVLRPEEKLEQFKSDRPSVITMEYLRQLRADVCAACGIPSVLAFPEQMQGTQYRGALDMAATFFKCRSAVMQEVVRRIWEYVIGESKNFDETLNPAPPDWYRVTIPSPRAVNVDVGRNSAAMLSELQAGVTTYSQIYGPLGIHWEDAFRELAEQRKVAVELGILPATQPTPAP
jgi:capsid protein